MNEARPKPEKSDRLARWSVAVVLVATALTAVSWRVVRAWRGCDILSDDAYYYTVTARNFVATGRFTFDGVCETNGFHPLLFWVEAAAFAVFGADADPMSQYVGLVCGMSVVFVLSIIGCAWLVARPVASADDAAAQGALLLATCALLVPRFTTPYLGGMEAILVLPLLMLLGVAAWRSRYASAGLLAILLVMARLDTLPYVVFPVALACAWREHRRGGGPLRAGLWLLLPAVAATLVLMAWHNWRFGHPMPIHGVLKSCLPWIHFQWHQVFARARDPITLPAALASALVGVCLLLHRRHAGGEVRGLGITAAVLCLMLLAAFMLFQKWSKPVPVWYFGPAVLTGTFALAVGVANTVSPRRLRVLGAAAAIGVLAVNFASIAKAWYSGSPLWAAPQGENAQAAGRPLALIEFMKSRPPDERWACTDCGKLAFWSERAVVNLDGLINDFEYQDVLRDRRLGAYLRERNVRYLVFLAWNGPQTRRRQYEPMYECRVAPDVFSGDYDRAEFYVYSYRYMTYSDRVRLPRAAEVWRSAPAPDGRALAKAVVFDLQHKRDAAF